VTCHEGNLCCLGWCNDEDTFPNLIALVSLICEFAVISKADLIFIHKLLATLVLALK